MSLAAAAAQDDGWAPLLYGIGTAVCHPTDVNVECLALRCGKGRGLELAWLSTTADATGAVSAAIRIDGRSAGTLPLVPVGPEHGVNYVLVDLYDPARHDDLLAAMRRGRAMTIDFHASGNGLPLSLAGSSDEIARVMEACAPVVEAAREATAPPLPPRSPIDPDAVAGLRAYLEEIHGVAVKVRDGVVLQQFDLDVPADGIGEILLAVQPVEFGLCGNAGCVHEILRPADGGPAVVYRVLGFGLDVTDAVSGGTRRAIAFTRNGALPVPLAGETSATAP